MLWWDLIANQKEFTKFAFTLSNFVPHNKIYLKYKNNHMQHEKTRCALGVWSIFLHTQNDHN